MPWYVLSVVPASQMRVCARAGELGFETYTPMARELAKPERPLMPGYSFVLDPQFALFEPYRWGATAVEPLSGCRGFVSTFAGPTAIPETELADLRGREARGEFDSTGRSANGRYRIPRWARKGRLVEFVKGPFVGMFGSVSATVGDKLVSVWLTIMGRTTAVNAPFEWVAPCGRMV